jgi:hypothetical protein
LITLTIFCEAYRLWKSSLGSLLQPPATSFRQTPLTVKEVQCIMWCYATDMYKIQYFLAINVKQMSLKLRSSSNSFAGRILHTTYI